MHKSRESLDKQQASQMGYDPLLATAALSGCEIVKCQHYKDGKCNDPNDNPPMMSFDRPSEF